MSTDITISGRAIPKGSKKRFFLHVGETPTSRIDIPVVIVNGKSTGPTLCVTAGLHGTEYAGIEAATRIHNSLTPGEVAGAVIIVPTANVLAFQTVTATVNPVDGLNLNRSFPGDPQGSITRRIAHRLLNDVIAKAQYHIDLHGGEVTEDLRPFTVFAKTGDASLDKKSEAMARVYGVEHIWVNNYPGTSSEAASKLGIPSIVAESGRLGTYTEEEIGVHVNGISNVMKHLGILKGKPRPPPARQTVFTGSAYIRPRHGGVLRPLVGPSDAVRKGQAIAYVTDIWGDRLEEIKSPVNGIVQMLIPKRVVHTGDQIYSIWTK